MTGPDNVDIGSSGVDVGKLVRSASNPNPTLALPQGFTMTQSLYSTVQPGGTREASPFTTVDHIRRFVTGYQFEVTAGLDSTTEDYTGPAAVTNATASSTTVMASPPRPASGEWAQRKVTVAATAIPDTAALTYAIRGRNLGCSVDSSGEVSIGATAGTITVRVTASRHNYDEVTITITPYVAPASTAPTAESAPAPATAPAPPGASGPTVPPE
jgi:hypothetical protein